MAFLPGTFGAFPFPAGKSWQGHPGIPSVVSPGFVPPQNHQSTGMFSLLLPKKKKKILQQTKPIPAASGVSCHQPPSQQEKTQARAANSFFHGITAPSWNWSPAQPVRMGMHPQLFAGGRFILLTPPAGRFVPAPQGGNLIF